MPLVCVHLKGSTWSRHVITFYKNEGLQNIAKKEVCGLVGNGRDINLWNDVWLIDSCLAVQFPRLYSPPEDQVSPVATAAVKASIQPASVRPSPVASNVASSSS